ncbi:MAG: hypothetical protein ACQGVC_04940 [Myxococcota bacterium]
MHGWGLLEFREQGVWTIPPPYTRSGRPRGELHAREAILRARQALGFQADAGPAPADDYDGVITYVDRYVWDVTMFCQQLTLYVRDPETGYITATGWSWRPSVVRKTPQGHARLILAELFGRSPE